MPAGLRSVLALVLLVVSLAAVRADEGRGVCAPSGEARRTAPLSAAKDAAPSHPVPAGAGAWEARHGAHQFRARFSSDGLTLSPIDPGDGWRVRLALERHVQDGLSRPTVAASPVLLVDRLETVRDAHLTEWFLNGPKGLQHALDLQSAGRVRIEFALETGLAAKLSPDRRTIRFLDAAGGTILVGRDLRVVDGDGREAPARFELAGAGSAGPAVLALAIEASELTAPVHVRTLWMSPKSQESVTSPHGDPLEQLGGPGMAAPPSNDVCGSAAVVPGAGPFPYTSAAYDITDATTAGDPPTPSCQANVSRSVWFRFAPSSTGLYSFSLCSDAPTGTTVADTMLAIYTGSGACAGFSEVGGGCDDDACAVTDTQSLLSGLQLLSGTTYYIVAWQFGGTPPPPGGSTVQLRVTQDPPPPAAPANDQCAAAQVIPAAGPFPYLTTTVPDITGATSAGDPAPPTCQPLVSRSVWYSFTPAATASYAFTLCADGPTATTVDDTVMAIFSSNGVCSGLQELAGACNDDFNCVLEPTQSALAGITLTSGTTYYVVVWQFDTAPPASGNTAVQLRVTQSSIPGNDTCAAAIPIALHQPVAGTTLGALDGYQLPAASTCFAGLGQSVTTAPGRDVVYRFTAPQAGTYSFRVTDYAAGNAVLVAASDCPAGPAPATIAACLGAANRNSAAPGNEEVRCLPLAQGQSAYLYVDESVASGGGSFLIEATACAGESDTSGNSGTNNTPATANAFACGIEGSVATFDVDFFALGSPASGARLFAILDGVAANATDFDLRATTTADTLEYDHQDNDTAFGALSPNLAGSPLQAPSFLRVNYRTTSSAEPYRLYAAVQPAQAQAAAEVEPNATIGTATPGANLYFQGAIASAGDIDLFSFTAVAGEAIHVGLDLDPTRSNTPFNGILSLLDASGAPLLVVNDGNGVSSTTSGAGSLSATSPNSPGESLVYRARASGAYYAKVESSAGTTGDYLLSIARDCRIGPPIDLEVDLVDAPDPAAPGSAVVYTATVRNLSVAVASGVILRADPPAGASFVGVTTSQGSCTGSGPVFCALGTVTGGATATVSIEVTAPGAPGSIAAAAALASDHIDPNPVNDAAGEITTIGALDGDGDGVPDASDCSPGDASAWSIPGPAVDLRYPGTDAQTLVWSPPAAPGGPGILYDLLRSEDRTSFAAATCLANGVAVQPVADATHPTAAFFYLARTRNVCGSNLGTSSAGVPRQAPACP